MRSHVDLASILLCLNVFILCNKIMTHHLSKGLFSLILKAPSHSQDLFMAPLAQSLPLGASDLVLSISWGFYHSVQGLRRVTISEKSIALLVKMKILLALVNGSTANHSRSILILHLIITMSFIMKRDTGSKRCWKFIKSTHMMYLEYVWIMTFKILYPSWSTFFFTKLRWHSYWATQYLIQCQSMRQKTWFHSYSDPKTILVHWKKNANDSIISISLFFKRLLILKEISPWTWRMKLKWLKCTCLMNFKLSVCQFRCYYAL